MTILPDDTPPDAFVLHGEALATLQAIAPGTRPGYARLAMFSPPFLGQRTYLDPTDPASHLELGKESAPGDFVDKILDVCDELWRHLTDDGSLAVELGDGYMGSSGSGGDYQTNGKRAGQNKFAGPAVLAAKRRSEWPRNRSLVCIPEAVQIGLAYGRNPLNGNEHRQWLVRNSVAWCKTAATPGELEDRWRRGHSRLLVCAKSRNRFWNQWEDDERTYENLRDWWVMRARDPKEQGVEHFATFPGELVRKVIDRCTDYGDTVLDPFCGTGTTLRVAVGSGRRAVGIDLNPATCHSAVLRTGPLFTSHATITSDGRIEACEPPFVAERAGEGTAT